MTSLIHLAPLYADVNNRGTPRGFPGTPSVPTPHEVSAAVFSVHTQNIQRSRGLSAMFMAFGQFVDHDFGYTTHPTCQLPANRLAYENHCYRNVSRTLTNIWNFILDVRQ